MLGRIYSNNYLNVRIVKYSVFLDFRIFVRSRTSMVLKSRIFVGTRTSKVSHIRIRFENRIISCEYRINFKSSSAEIDSIKLFDYSNIRLKEKWGFFRFSIVREKKKLMNEEIRSSARNLLCSFIRSIKFLESATMLQCLRLSPPSRSDRSIRKSPPRPAMRP